MKSIRRTLLRNALLLLVVALAIVGWLTYRMIEHNLQEKQEATRKLLDFQIASERDKALEQQAYALADLAHALVKPQRIQQLQFTPLGMLNAPASPFSHLQLMLWIEEFKLANARNFQNFRFYSQLRDIHLEEDEINRVPESEDSEFIQLRASWGSNWRSRSLGPENLPLPTQNLASITNLYQPVFDDIILDGKKARLVTFSALVTRIRVPSRDTFLLIMGSVAAGPGSIPGRSRFLPNLGMYSFIPPPPRGSRTQERLDREREMPPWMYVQCAWSLEEDHPVWSSLLSRRDAQLAELERENQATMYRTRSQLVWIGVVTLASTLIGGWLLIGSGLRPLHRLSDAVSRISPKDFQLPIDSKLLPSEMVPVTQRLEQTLVLLQRAFEREKRAAADISHELRTPIAALLTTLEVSLKKPRSVEAYQEILQDCRTIGKQLNQLVERMLQLAWIDAGADQVRSKPVELTQLVEGCAAIGKPLAEAQGLQFRITVEEPIRMTTDPDKVREVLMNLMHNAIEYNRPNGQVELTAKPRDGGGVILEVRDTGIGIPREAIDKIFERFYRGDPSRNAVGAHAGLGLAIVKEYVDRLGGKLSVESAVGSGSKFRVELPNV